MPITTTNKSNSSNPNKNDRSAKTAELRKTHESLLKALGVPNAKYIPKSFFTLKSHPGGELFTSFYDNELKLFLHYPYNYSQAK